MPQQIRALQDSAWADLVPAGCRGCGGSPSYRFFPFLYLLQMRKMRTTWWSLSGSTPRGPFTHAYGSCGKLPCCACNGCLRCVSRHWLAFATAQQGIKLDAFIKAFHLICNPQQHTSFRHFSCQMTL